VTVTTGPKSTQAKTAAAARRSGGRRGPSRHAVLHGQRIAYERHVGAGPLLVLVHGVGSSSTTWASVVPVLVEAGANVLTVDLPGHGGSDKDRGDYSIGALSCTLRDLLDHLGEPTCVLVGHSLGGGIAMQFSYQFPGRCTGLVLVSSGGLGPEASLLLRAASLPGAELVLPLIAHRRTVDAVAAVGKVLVRLHIGAELFSEDSLSTLRELEKPAARGAFLATLRGVIDASGQRVSAVRKLPSASHLPTLIVWGDRDAIIPIEHGGKTVQLLPSARLVVFPGAGHEPYRHDPQRFADLLVEHAALVGKLG
jgi:pimeloyl-ACP methyl ester carboxylesterase